MDAFCAQTRHCIARSADATRNLRPARYIPAPTGMALARQRGDSYAQRKVAIDQEQHMSTLGRPKIVILGAGFGGVYAAQALGKLLPHAVDAEITLINDNNFFVFTPMLTEVAGGELDPRHIVCAIRRF